MLIHTVFDLLAACAALGMTLFVYHWRLRDAARKIDSAGPLYGLALVMGAAIGGFGAGTLNLWLSGAPGIGRSIVGALAGAIIAVEIFKRWRGISGSTGLIFVPAFATSVVVGRWGCFLAGLGDDTYGTPTGLPWGHDFGDGIARHPVQLYESLTMAVFLAVALTLIGRRNGFFMQNGFYLLVLVYAGQRFLWEFLKPYGSVVGTFNLFHLICAGLVIYSLAMMARGKAS
ncbi:diacylglyceryl transferase [Aestuariivirga litoralis]|uniref:Diacylglyceryl transferase n=1 Tax=Aestuariivirga litoralis TaxID=2650924 RepID=A0A2W2B6S5_9HYPH|nr:prolipoprotein diacylglyceryl transferase family protein [Aestuariivirga litoralis]PZF76024.1 diacylglyceryl transferase [Aestuariivirga litoralis]